MKIYILGHSLNYELEKLTRLFFPFERIEFTEQKRHDDIDLFAAAFVEEDNNGYKLTASAGFGAKKVTKSIIWHENPNTKNDMPEKELEHALAGLLFECYAELTNYRPKWGILTGIRPAKLYRRFEKMLGTEGADEYFLNIFKVHNEKLSLLKRTANSEDEIISASRSDSVSIYISIPFCPSRCSYCSFVSHSTEKSADLIPEYLKLLCEEIKVTAEIINKLSLKVMTVYIGGGTPTTLTAEQLKTLLGVVRENFGYDIKEFTVEAGRPDTISEEKLVVIKNAGVDRISINPQTMNNNVLRAIGRRHTAEDTVEKFHLARKLGFDNINMDLIAGLPSDTEESFEDTLKKVISLNPESVTVHSLSVKRSSNILGSNSLELEDGVMASKMVSYAEKTLEENGILPYYMYRQSRTVGNLENVGYSVSQREGLYNVYIMDETHSIFACGASAVTKLRSQTTGDIERIFNFKYPYEYIKQFDEILHRKERIEKFYAEQEK
jgi:oxygen-independent coproporphyrinogen-3 oxidase